MVVPLFLSAGRHAGTDGDIAHILEDVRSRVGDAVNIWMGDLVGGSPSRIPAGLIDALVQNAQKAVD